MKKIQNDYQILKTNMEKKYDDEKIKENEIHNNQTTESQDKLVALQLSKNMEIESLRQDYEKKINEVEEKLKFSKDEISNLQNENTKQMESASNIKIEQQCRDNIELKSVVEILEHELASLHNEITVTGYLNQEMSDVFLSCCDAMCEWDTSLNILVEGNNNADININSGNIHSTVNGNICHDNDDNDIINNNNNNNRN